MAHDWYYTRGGETRGPVSAGQMKHLVTTGVLRPDDRLWPENSTEEKALTAAQVREMLERRREAQEAENQRREWREEIDSLFSSPEPAPAPLPDWLREMQPDEPSAEPAAPAAVPGWVEESLPPAPAAVARPVDLPPSAPPPPLAQPVGTPPPLLSGAALLEKMGLDPATGRVVDQAKFDRWQMEQQHRTGEELRLPPGTDPDPFRTARKQLAAWMDLEKNRRRLAAGDVDGLKRDPALQAFLGHFARYGGQKLANLWQYVDFLIEHRMKG
jgi:hypothetical protein